MRQSIHDLTAQNDMLKRGNGTSSGKTGSKSTHPSAAQSAIQKA